MNIAKKHLGIILLACLVIYSPIVYNPSFFLERGDLKEFFWPIYHYTKEQILYNHQFPLWNNLFLSGTPLLPDPQSPLFYFPNIIFLFLPLNVGFIISSFLHLILGALGIYFLTRNVLRLSPVAAIFGSILYISIPRIGGIIEAGHFGLLESFAWFPLTIYALLRLLQTNKLIWAGVLSLSLSSVFYTHTLTFGISLFFAALLAMLIIIKERLNKIKQIIIPGLVSLSLLLGLIGVTILSQVDWIPNTTRYLLLNNPDVYPKWVSYKEFFFAMMAPWIRGQEFTNSLDTEKWIAIGILPAFLSFVGFLKIKRTYQIAVILICTSVGLISLNNLSPAYPLLIELKPYDLLRVSTRFWFIINIIVVILATYAAHNLAKNKRNKFFVSIILFLTITESTFLNWSKLTKPIVHDSRIAPTEVSKYISNDNDRFRVFCVTRCISQKDAAYYNLELIEGYSTLQQKNYYQQMWQFTGKFWNYYTLALPPSGIYLFEEIKPNSVILGEHNTKYIVSPYMLKDDNLVEEIRIKNFYIYKNLLVKDRAYYINEKREPSESANIIEFQPNYIKVSTENKFSNQLILSEVYSSGWHAYLDGKVQVKIQERSNGLRHVDLSDTTKFVEFKYSPRWFEIGVIVYLGSLILTLGLIIYAIKQKSYR